MQNYLSCLEVQKRTCGTLFSLHRSCTRSRNPLKRFNCSTSFGLNSSTHEQHTPVLVEVQKVQWLFLRTKTSLWMKLVKSFQIQFSLSLERFDDHFRLSRCFVFGPVHSFPQHSNESTHQHFSIVTAWSVSHLSTWYCRRTKCGPLVAWRQKRGQLSSGPRRRTD